MYGARGFSSLPRSLLQASKISGLLKSVAEHDTKVVSFYCNIYFFFGGSRHISAVGVTCCTYPWKGEGDAYWIARTLSRRVPLPVLNGSTFVKWGDVKQAARSDRVIQICASCQWNKNSRFVRWATHFVLRRAPTGHASIIHRPKKGHMNKAGY